MSELQIAWLELGIVGGLGAIFVFVGIIMVVVISRKNKLCTRQTNGVVTGHRFPGQGKKNVSDHRIHGGWKQLSD